MSLSASRLNSARYASALSDIQTQFPLPVGLQPAEQTAYALYQQKMAHAISDHEGTDVVSEITTNAIVNPNTLAITPSNILDSTPHVCSGNGTVTTGTGTVS